MLKHLVLGTLCGWVMSWLMVVTASPILPLALYALMVVTYMSYTVKHPEIKED